jgi:hypothetical protein
MEIEFNFVVTESLKSVVQATGINTIGLQLSPCPLQAETLFLIPLLAASSSESPADGSPPVTIANPLGGTCFSSRRTIR